jgi:hypothetical protein
MVILFLFPPTMPAIYHHHDAGPLHPQRVANDSLVDFHPRHPPFTTTNESQTTHWWVSTTVPAIYHPQQAIMTRWWVSTMAPFTTPNESLWLIGGFPSMMPAIITPNESQTTHWWVSTTAPAIYHPQWVSMTRWRASTTMLGPCTWRCYLEGALNSVIVHKALNKIDRVRVKHCKRPTRVQDASLWGS